MSVERAMVEVPPAEFLRWKVLRFEDPWGEYREDFRHATLAAMLANLITREPQQIGKFMPFSKTQEQADEIGGQDPASMDAMLEGWGRSRERVDADGDLEGMI